MHSVTPNDLRRTFATWLKQNDVDSAVVAALMGHSSTAMVDRVYGKLDAASFRRAIRKLPSGAVSSAPTQTGHSHTGGTSTAQTCGEHGTDGTVADQRVIADSDEESATSTRFVVRAEGLEPWTRRSQNLNHHAILQ